MTAQSEAEGVGYWTPPAPSQHTSGPWCLNGCELIGLSTVIATLHWHSGRAIENDADGLLIQAAPDMLAALIEVEKAFTNPYDNGPYEDGEMPALDAVRAAITKASVPSSPRDRDHAK